MKTTKHEVMTGVCDDLGCAMTHEELIATARLIAETAHAGQFRRDGVTPYITHPAAVAEMLSDRHTITICTAWLHDVLEDSNLDTDSLRHLGIPESVIVAVLALTKTEGEDYQTYLDRLDFHPIARRVKIADMIHNLSSSPSAKQIEKYSRGILFLSER